TVRYVLPAAVLLLALLAVGLAGRDRRLDPIVCTAAAAYVAFHAMSRNIGGEWPLVPSDRWIGAAAAVAVSTAGLAAYASAVRTRAGTDGAAVAAPSPFGMLAPEPALSAVGAGAPDDVTGTSTGTGVGGMAGDGERRLAGPAVGGMAGHGERRLAGPVAGRLAGDEVAPGATPMGPGTRRAGAQRAVAGAMGAAVFAGVVAGGWNVVDEERLDRHITSFDALENLWWAARGPQDDDLALVGDWVQHPYVGSDLADTVRYLGVPTGELSRPPETCAELRRALRAGDFDVAVVQRRLLENPAGTDDAAGWLAAIPGADLEFRNEEGAVVRLPDPIPPVDEDGCD
ncbi:MAG TPA: hypothetical protein VKA65_10155, partial [Acidimicrobiales bacterium]|nr:hypothetical protein [Acidimicrobiales bacterium]